MLYTLLAFYSFSHINNTPKPGSPQEPGFVLFRGCLFVRQPHFLCWSNLSKVRQLVFDEIELLAICREAGVVQDLRDLLHDLTELIHSDDDHALVGGLDALLVQVLVEGVEAAVHKEVPSL